MTFLIICNAAELTTGQKLTKLSEMDWMEVFETKKAEAQALKAAIEKTDKEIDQMVYALYGLTEEEIGIVEGSVNQINRIKLHPIQFARITYDPVGVACL